MKIPYEYVRSMRKSGNRAQTLMALHTLGEANVQQIARETGIEPRRVDGCLNGRLPHFSEERALVPLGLAEKRGGRWGPYYVETVMGSWLATILTDPRAQDEFADVPA